MLKPDTIKHQKQFAQSIRQGKPANIPGVSQKGWEQYRRLVRNIFANTLEQAFPVSYRIFTQKQWDQLVDDFMLNHNSQSPQLWRMPQEFVQFVVKNNYSITFQMPWLNDLLYLEWIEIEVHGMPDEKLLPYRQKGDAAIDQIYINPHHRIIEMQYPVHIIKAELSSRKKGQYFVLIYRHPETNSVRFVNLSMLHVYFIEMLKQGRKSFQQHIDDIAQQFQISNVEQLKKHLLLFVNDQLQQKCFLGYLQLS